VEWCTLHRTTIIQVLCCASILKVSAIAAMGLAFPLTIPDKPTSQLSTTTSPSALSCKSFSQPVFVLLHALTDASE
jgi:hypothetical protein